METKGFSQFEISINVFVSSFRFIWIPMLCVCGYYEYLYSYSAWIDSRRQNLTSTDVRFWRLESIAAPWGLWSSQNISTFSSCQRWTGTYSGHFYSKCNFVYNCFMYMTSSHCSFISWHCWRICLLKMRNIPHINPAPVVICNINFWLFQIFIHVLTDQYQYCDYVFAVEIVFKRSFVLQVLKSNQWWKHKHIFNWSTAGLMLGHRLWRRPDIKPGQLLVLQYTLETSVPDQSRKQV